MLDWTAAAKKFQKTFAKPLDKRNGMWYNTEAVRESEAAEKNWSLKIEQQEIEVQAKASAKISKFLENECSVSRQNTYSKK